MYHQHGVVNLIYRMCGDVQLAEDTAQEAFLKAWTHLDRYQPGTSLRSWLYRIAVNSALDVLRKSEEKPRPDIETVNPADTAPGPEAAYLQNEQSRLIQQAVMDLAEGSRAVLVLREYSGLSYQEISAALDIPLGTVMSRLNYARSRLRETLEPQLVLMESNHA